MKFSELIDDATQMIRARFSLVTICNLQVESEVGF